MISIGQRVSRTTNALTKANPWMRSCHEYFSAIPIPTWKDE